MTFYAWLLEQREREDPVGDLAKDAERDPCSPRRSASFHVWLAHLERHNCADVALNALRQAWFEYDGELPFDRYPLEVRLSLEEPRADEPDQ